MDHTKYIKIFFFKSTIKEHQRFDLFSYFKVKKSDKSTDFRKLPV